jgi:hypothetical protein
MGNSLLADLRVDEDWFASAERNDVADDEQPTYEPVPYDDVQGALSYAGNAPVSDLPEGDEPDTGDGLPQFVVLSVRRLALSSLTGYYTQATSCL